jgi:hypothetical protein
MGQCFPHQVQQGKQRAMQKPQHRVDVSPANVTPSSVHLPHQ